MKTLAEIEDSLKYFQEIRDRAKREGRHRTSEGAQWNIDNLNDAKYAQLRKGK